MLSPRIKYASALAAAFFLTVFPFPCHADLDEIQALDFGRWAITSNSASYHITVQTDGSYSNSSQLVMLEPPQQGIYQVDGLPPNADILSVDVTMVQPLQGGGEEFTMDNFQVIAPDANGLGVTTITLGARANTSGNGGSYSDGPYSGVLEIEINL
jgi:hypothetical protein